MTVHFNAARGRWCYDFRRAGRRYAGYADHPDTGAAATSRRQAAEHEALIRARAAAQEGALQADAQRGPADTTLAEVLAYYARHRGAGSRSWRGIKAHIKELLEHFGAATPAERITAADVRAYATQASAQAARRYVGGCDGVRAVYKPTGKPRSPSTVNKVLNTLRASLRLAVRDEMIRRAPDVLRLATPDDVPRPMPVEDLQRVMGVAPPHLRDTLLICALTGMRESECLGLVWGQVDLAGEVIRLESVGTKANRGRVVYLHPRVLETLRRIDGERAKPHLPDQHVILYRHKGRGKPRPIRDIHSAWYAALKKSGLQGRYNFHNTRATFCTLLAGQGLDPVHIRDLAGHVSIVTTMRYVKATNARLRAGVALLDGAAAALASKAPSRL